MLRGNRLEIDLEIAHHALDHVAPQRVFGHERHASDCRQAAGLDLPGVGGGGRRLAVTSKPSVNGSVISTPASCAPLCNCLRKISIPDRLPA